MSRQKHQHQWVEVERRPKGKLAHNPRTGKLGRYTVVVKECTQCHGRIGHREFID